MQAKPIFLKWVFCELERKDSTPKKKKGKEKKKNSQNSNNNKQYLSGSLDFKFSIGLQLSEIGIPGIKMGNKGGMLNLLT